MESFHDTTTLVIKQQFEALEALANAAANAIDMDALGNLGETANKYNVYTNDGGDKYRVIESSEYCGCEGRACCAPGHALELHVFLPEASNSSEAMSFDRPCKCTQCCHCACADICRHEMTVYEGPKSQGNAIGYIKQPFLGGGFSPALDIMDREGEEPIASISGPTCCIGGICCDHTFEVTDKDGTVLGKIVKERPDDLEQLAKELSSDADVFTLHFNDVNLDVKKKASMFAALHLIDYMFFENEGDVNIDLVNGACSCKCCDLYCCGCTCPCACNCGGGDDDDDGGGDE